MSYNKLLTADQAVKTLLCFYKRKFSLPSPLPSFRRDSLEGVESSIRGKEEDRGKYFKYDTFRSLSFPIGILSTSSNRGPLLQHKTNSLLLLHRYLKRIESRRIFPQVTNRRPMRSPLLTQRVTKRLPFPNPSTRARSPLLTQRVATLKSNHTHVECVLHCSRKG